MSIRNLFTALVALVLLAAGSAGLRAQALSSMPAPTVPQLVILDTDIGDDIDDAFALALILRSPEFHLLGIETAYGDTELRARLVDRYLAAVGRTDVPVTAGVATPHSNVFTQAAYAQQHQSQCLYSLRSATPESSNTCSLGGATHADGVAFLLDQIRAHPGQITLLAIGPLSNIGAAIQRDTATFRKLKRVVIMGGSVDSGYEAKNGEKNTPPSAEWNILCDPAGAKALFASGVPIFVMPLDSTQVHLDRAQLGAILAHGSPLTDQLTLLYHQWTGAEEWRTPTLYDPVAVTYALRPALCPMTPMRLEVGTEGSTRRVEGIPNAQVCLHSDEKAFLDLLVNRIAADPDAGADQHQAQ